MAAGAILPPLFFGQCRMRGQHYAPWHGRLKDTLDKYIRVEI
jgi:hypothetical protein